MVSTAGASTIGASYNWGCFCDDFDCWGFFNCDCWLLDWSGFCGAVSIGAASTGAASSKIIVGTSSTIATGASDWCFDYGGCFNCECWASSTAIVGCSIGAASSTTATGASSTIAAGASTGASMIGAAWSSWCFFDCWLCDYCFGYYFNCASGSAATTWASSTGAASTIGVSSTLELQLLELLIWFQLLEPQ